MWLVVVLWCMVGVVKRAVGGGFDIKVGVGCKQACPRLILEKIWRW